MNYEYDVRNVPSFGPWLKQQLNEWQQDGWRCVTLFRHMESGTDFLYALLERVVV